MNYQKLHQDIMSLDRNIRMVTICDTDGKIMYSDHRPGVTNLLTPDESRKSLEMAVNAWKSRTQLAPKIGKGRYVLAEYEKIKRITMPLGDRHLVYVTTELQANHDNIISQITRLGSRPDNA
jgi:predicted transcriptional regulator